MAGDMTDQEFADKVDWEGGLLDATFGYGLTSDALEDRDGELFQAMREFDDWRNAGQPLVDRITAMLDPLLMSHLGLDDE